jgi:hypothetical protein
MIKVFVKFLHNEAYIWILIKALVLIFMTVCFKGRGLPEVTGKYQQVT